MSHGVYANLESLEGVVSGSVTLDLKRKSRKLVITNDHATKELLYKFNESENMATLKGTESLSLFFTTKTIILCGDNIDYRVWVFG